MGYINHWVWQDCVYMVADYGDGRKLWFEYQYRLRQGRNRPILDVRPGQMYVEDAEGNRTRPEGDVEERFLQEISEE